MESETRPNLQSDNGLCHKPSAVLHYCPAAVHGVPAGRGSPPHPGSEEEAGHMSRLPCRRGSSSPLPPPRPLVLIDPLFFINFLDTCLCRRQAAWWSPCCMRQVHTPICASLHSQSAQPVNCVDFAVTCVCLTLLTVSHTASQAVYLVYVKV